MDHEGELNVDLARGGISPDSIKATLQPDSPANGDASIPRNEEITRKIRNPLPAPASAPASAQADAPASAPAEVEPEASEASEVTPCVAPVIEMSMDVSKNLHPQELLPPPTEDLRPAAKTAVKQAEAPSPKPAKVRHKGLIVVAVIVVAGTSIDLALWLTSGTRQENIGRSTSSIPPQSTSAGGDPVPGISRAPSTLPIVEPLPEGSGNSEANPAKVLATKGGAAVNSDLAKDNHPRAVKGPPSDPNPQLERADSVAPSAETTAKTKRDGKFKLAPKGGDDNGGDLRSTKARRTTTTIDEINPYAP